MYSRDMTVAVEQWRVPVDPPSTESSDALGPAAPLAESLSAAMREFLAWVAFRPRTHADAMEAWQSHCPRFTLWEDALEAGLIELAPGSGGLGSACVRLTARGQAALDRGEDAPRIGRPVVHLTSVVAAWKNWA
jgi:hypothetical protein